jgi:short-subunit dehydrogenase
MADFIKKYGEWALISGASSGIGLEYAKQLAKKGLNIILVARRKEKLEEVANSIQQTHGIKTKVIVADLATEAGMDDVKSETKELEVGLLVNNVGREDSGHFLESSLKDAIDTLDLNCKVPLQLTHHFSKKMAERKKGGIIFMSSLVSFQGVSYIANYAATKAYDLIFAESIASELKKYNIDVLTVAPGFTKTNLSPDFNFEGLPLKPISPELVAKKGIKNLGKKRLTIPGAINKFLYFSGKFIQPRIINTFAFSKVFSLVLRKKLAKVEH